MLLKDNIQRVEFLFSESRIILSIFSSLLFVLQYSTLVEPVLGHGMFEILQDLTNYAKRMLFFNTLECTGGYRCVLETKYAAFQTHRLFSEHWL